MAKAKNPATDVAEKPKDRHKSNFLVRLPEEYKSPTLAVTGKTRRTITMEIRILLEELYARHGIEFTPPK